MKKAVTSFAVQLESFIDLGIALTHKAQEDQALYSSDIELVFKLHSEYSNWKYSICALLNQNGFSAESLLFTEADNVPLLSFEIVSSVPYISPKSKESQKLLRAIRLEVSKKLSILRKVKDNSQFSQDVSGRFIITNNHEGDYSCKGKLIPFNKKSIHYHVFVCVYNSVNQHADYKEIDNYLRKHGFGGKKTKAEMSQRIRNALNVFKKKRTYPDIIKNLLRMESDGVRLENPRL